MRMANAAPFAASLRAFTFDGEIQLVHDLSSARVPPDSHALLPVPSLATVDGFSLAEFKAVHVSHRELEMQGRNNLQHRQERSEE